VRLSSVAPSLRAGVPPSAKGYGGSAEAREASKGGGPREL